MREVINRMKKIIATVLVMIFIVSCDTKPIKSKESFTADLKVKAAEALRFCKRNNLNTEICILIDMSMHSGKKRLVLWDMQKNKVIKNSLVSHGAGKSSNRYKTKNSPKFSNKRDSHLSSLGKYVIGDRAWSNYGHHIKYWLNGLESTNSNAVRRVVVLHGWKRVKNSEVFSKGTAEGWGVRLLV